MTYILNDTKKDCKNKGFHSFEFRYVYDNKITNIEIKEGIILTISLGYMQFKPQFYGLCKKIKNARQKCFRFTEIVYSPVKIDSSLTNVNIR